MIVFSENMFGSPHTCSGKNTGIQNSKLKLTFPGFSFQEILFCYFLVNSFLNVAHKKVPLWIKYVHKLSSLITIYLGCVWEKKFYEKVLLKSGVKSPQSSTTFRFFPLLYFNGFLLIKLLFSTESQVGATTRCRERIKCLFFLLKNRWIFL